MAAVVVTIVPREGADPRTLHIDDFRDEKGKEIRGGASLIDTLKRQERRGELHSVTVRPEGSTEEAPTRKSPIRKAAPKAEPEATE